VADWIHKFTIAAQPIDASDLRVRWTVKRAPDSSPNLGEVRVFNLSPEARAVCLSPCVHCRITGGGQ
jgi:hypothetical protein